MYRLRILYGFVVFVIVFIFSPNADAFNIYRAGDVIVGQEYNDVLKSWFDREFSIWAGKSENGTEYLVFKGDTGLGDATVWVLDSPYLRKKLKKALEKAIEWSDIARESQADTSKNLGCFGSGKFGICEVNRSSLKKNQMGLSFFATNGGKQTNLIITMIDTDNQFTKATIYFDLLQMRNLLKAFKGIETAFEKARKTERDQELFK